MLKGDVVLMFSGGVDSTTSAIDLLKAYERVHLVTYANGYGHFWIKRSEIHVEDLRGRFGAERVLHTIMSSRALYERITINTLAQDYRGYGGGFIWCVGCKLAMHTMTIIYALERGLTDVAEGASPDTDYFAEQTPQMMEALRRFYTEYDLNFVLPVYAMGGRKKQIARMKEMGMRAGLAWGNRNPGLQPMCVPGNILNLLDTFFGIHPRHNPDELARYVEDRLVICRAYIRERLGRKTVPDTDRSQHPKGRSGSRCLTPFSGPRT